MAKKEEKTNVMRLLTAAKIPFTPHYYDHSDGQIDGNAIARKLSQPPEQVFKTLVTRGNPNGIALAVIPGDAELSLKKFAAVFGNKNAEMVPLKDVLPLTGYIRGGCSPVGTKKPYPVCIHESAILYDKFYVSAGQRGLQFVIAPDDLAKAVGAEFADIVMD